MTAIPPHPSFEQKHVEGAKIYAGRDNMILGLAEELQGGVIAEIGVAEGAFSKFLIETLKPKKFVAFDLFDRHKLPSVYGKPPAEVYQGKTQLEFYRDHLAPAEAVIEEGPSADRLATYPDHIFDMIYVDAGHDYMSVKADADLALRKTKPGKIVIFNDYIMYDHIARYPYGVVPAVNRMVVEGDHRVIAYALSGNMFCDIAVRLKSDA